jgi:hypothetical protein
LRPADSVASAINNTIKYKLSNDVCEGEFYPISETKWVNPQFNHNLCLSFYVDRFILINNTLSYNLTANIKGLRFQYGTIGNLTAANDDSAFIGMR